jgi:hypothetical protein
MEMHAEKVLKAYQKLLKFWKESDQNILQRRRGWIRKLK